MGTGLFSRTYPDSSNKLKPKNPNWEWEASDIAPDISSFGGILSAADDTVQKALDTIDDASLGTSLFECTVGASGADYTTVGAAIVAGCERILVIDNTTEAANITLAGNVYIHILPNSRVSMGTYRFLAGTSESLVIESVTNSNATPGGSVRYSYASANPLITGISNLTLDGVRFDNASTTTNCWIVDQTNRQTDIRNCKFILPNYAGCGISLAGTTGFQKITDSSFTGGGTNCYNGISATGSSQLSNIQVNGTWSVAAFQYAIIGSQSTNIYFNDDCRARFDRSVSGVFSNSTATGLIIELQFCMGSNLYLIQGNVFLTQHRTSISNSIIQNGDITVNANIDFCKISNCYTGDTNGGGNTITISAGCDKTTVKGCTTEAAIANGGTDTELNNNTRF